MHITPSVNVIEHAIVQSGSSLEWPAILVDLTGALSPHPDEPVTASGLDPTKVSKALRDVRLLATNLRDMVELEHEIRGVPPNPKTGFLVRTLRAIFYFTMPDCAIWEFAEVVRPMHPLAHENPLAQWLPKTVEASFLLLHPVFDFPSGEHASADACSSSAPSDKRSPIGSQEESVGSSASSRDDGPSLDHASNATSHSSPISMKSHEDGGRMAEEHIKMTGEKGEADEMDEMDGTDDTDGEDREDETDREDGEEGASEVDDPESMSPGSESSASADGLNPIASQIHMLSDPIQRPMPLLGLLCMADVDNIFDVMASMLHQRRAWGLSNQPIVGLAFDQYQTSVQVIFGWFGDSDVSQSYCVPLPRVAYAALGCTAREKGGIFDLADPLSAEALATFLLSLREKIELISAEGDARAEDVFAQVTSGAISFWRADGPVPMMDADMIRCHAADRDVIGPGEDAVYSWAADVNAACSDSDRIRDSKSSEGSDAHDAETKSMPTSRASSKERPGLKPVEQPTRRSSRSAASQKSQSQLSLPTVDENNAEDHVAPPKKDLIGITTFGECVKRYSASEFARAPANKISGYRIHPVYMWMLDRNAVCYSFTPTALLDEFQAKAVGSWLVYAKEHFKLYETMTALYLPSAWIDNPPTKTLTTRHVELLKSFLSGSDAVQRREDDKLAGRIDCVYLIDDKSPSWLEGCLTYCLPLSFQALAQMKKNKDDQVTHSVDEIAWREGWSLISSVVGTYFTEGKVRDGGSNPVMVWDTSERILRLPTIDPSIGYPGDSLELTEKATIAEQMTAIAYELGASTALANCNMTKAKAAYTNNDTPSRARALADAQNSFSAAYQAGALNSELFNRWVERRETLPMSQVQGMHPLTAKCDGVAVVRIEEFFEGFDPEWAKSFALVPRSKPPSAKNLSTEVDNAFGRRIDALPKIKKGKTDTTSSSYGMFIDRRDAPPTAHSDVMYSASFRTAAHIEPAPGSSPFDVPDLAKKLQNTHIGTSAEEQDETDDAGDDDEVVLDEKNTLEIPVLVREYKRTISAPRHAAANQGRLDLVAVVKFLGMLGITDFPIFGLVTEGAMGAVICAWGERQQDSEEIRIRIIDRTVRVFDLTTVEGIVNYTSFVAKLHKEHAPRLASLFEERQIRAHVFEDYQKGDARLQWNMTQKFGTKRKGKQKA